MNQDFVEFTAFASGVQPLVKGRVQTDQKQNQIFRQYYGKCLSSYLLFIVAPALRQFLPWSFRIFNADSLDCPTSDSAAAPTLLLLHLHRLFAAIIFPPSFEQHLSLMSKTSTCRLLTSVPQQIVPDHSFLHMPLQLPLSPLLSPNPSLVLPHSSQTLCHFNPLQYCTRCCKFLLWSSQSSGK